MPKAKFEGICRSIKQKIEAQDYPYQSLLPAESELIQEYGCARNTLRRALADLTAAGYLQPIQGKGVRVIYRPAGKTAFLIGVIESFQETDQRNNLHAVTKVVRFDQVETDERLASQSGFMVGEPLWAVERVRYLEGKALILDVNYFSQAMVPGLTAEIAARSIYEYIEKVLHIRITTTKRRVTVERATTRDEALLDQVMPQAIVRTETPYYASGALSITAGYNDSGLVGYCVEVQAHGFGGLMTAVVGVNTNGEVTGVAITRHQGTEGVGTDAMTQEYLDQYVGKSGTIRTAGDNSVDAASGATATSEAVTSCVNQALAIVANLDTEGSVDYVDGEV